MVQILWLLVFVAALPLSAQEPLPQPEIRVSELESRIHELVNAEREKEGLRRLRADARLADIARAHSRDMAERRFFDHVSPEGATPKVRADQAGYNCRKTIGHSIVERLGENLLLNHTFAWVRVGAGRRTYGWNSPETIAETTVKEWMESPGHRENILQEFFERAGVGISITDDGRVYVTQMFC